MTHYLALATNDMKTITEQEIQGIMQKTPQFSRDQIITSLKGKGYTIADSTSSATSTSAIPQMNAPSNGGTDWKQNLKNGAAYIGGNILQTLTGPAFPFFNIAAQHPKETEQGMNLLAGSSAQLIAKPVVSIRAGLTNDYKPVNVPIAGPVRPFENPLSPASQYIAQGAGQTSSPEEVAAAKKIANSNLLEAGGDTLGALLETASLGTYGAAKKPLTAMAEKLYQSALKPTADALAKDVVQTGLKERVWLTKGGVEKAAQKIDLLESQIGDAIQAAKDQGITISTKGIKEFVDPIRSWFNTVDVNASKAAQKYIDTTVKDFTKKYGKEIPIEAAQELKVNTMRYLRNAYGELSNVGKETQKQMARFLKEGIAEKAPVVDTVNKRLKDLYALDQSLEGAAKRIGNLNLLGLGAKLGAAAGGKAGAAIGLVADLLDKSAIKSGAAIGLNELANLSGGASTIPVTALLNYVLGKVPPRSTTTQNK